MPMQKTHNISASNGEYTTALGETKKRWNNIGSIFTDSETGRQSIKLDSIPVGAEWSGWASVFPVEQKQTPTPTAPDDMDY